ncbi:hypothetical protein KVF89_25260 [Nocardioides carbamazepini]|uniref:hypothetical protein n=1 Tax=Nocardioides carbamazepini TaxID=2854259 RepID=UPI002149D285|nr:hypothetical protein [Nocardioides carbamazepini]MCR1785869.1 hypothetical protein [Nocardioides carbamazepini]
MAVIALTSASGSPGVTTTAVAMALNWPRPVVLVEADPTGGSGILAGFLRGTTAYDGGLVEIALSPHVVAESLRDVVRPLAPDVSFVAGPRTHTQAAALRDVWEPLGAALADLDENGQDVVIDCGRLGLVGSPAPLLERADLSLLLSRATLPALAAARSWAELARNPTTGWQQAGVFLIGEGQPYRASEVSKVLGIPVVTDLPDDPEEAAVYHRGTQPARNHGAGVYARAVTSAVQAIRARVARRRFNKVNVADVGGVAKGVPR